MALSRKDIMLITNKETAFKEIEMKTEWDNHRKAAERSSWRKKHEPDKIKKCPNRGRRRKKEQSEPVNKEETHATSKEKPVAILIKQHEEEDDELCVHCQQSSEGYDFPCSHPICHPCFIRLFHENEGHMVCKVCNREYDFEDNLIDDD